MGADPQDRMGVRVITESPWHALFAKNMFILRNIFFLSEDAFGLLPPITRLNDRQAMYYLVNGYTAKVADMFRNNYRRYGSSLGDDFEQPPILKGKILWHED